MNHQQQPNNPYSDRYMKPERVSLDTPIKMGHFIVALVGLLIVISMAIYARGKSDQELTQRLFFIERKYDEIQNEQKQQYDEIQNEQKATTDKINQILIILENKANRK